jgi:transposase-like protein
VLQKETAVTAVPSIDPALPSSEFLKDRLSSASPDLLRELVSTFIDTLMSAEADALCGAPYGQPSPERTNTRNGYRHRDFDTRVGTLDVAIPKLRSGSYFPDSENPSGLADAGLTPSLTDLDVLSQIRRPPSASCLAIRFGSVTS